MQQLDSIIDSSFFNNAPFNMVKKMRLGFKKWTHAQL